MRPPRRSCAAASTRCFAKAAFELAYEIRTTGPAATTELENPEILVVFKGRDQDLLLEHNAELL